jgi:antitoxin component of MazEF toxin-antitoxin module
MIKEVKFRQYGGSLGTTLPKAMTDRLNISAGAFTPSKPMGASC